MPRKIARSTPQHPFGLPEMPVAVCPSRLSCRKAGKARIFRQTVSHPGNPGRQEKAHFGGRMRNVPRHV
jgi:hypothetical protein